MRAAEAALAVMERVHGESSRNSTGGGASGGASGGGGGGGAVGDDDDDGIDMSPDCELEEYGSAFNKPLIVVGAKNLCVLFLSSFFFVFSFILHSLSCLCVFNSTSASPICFFCCPKSFRSHAGTGAR